MQAIAKTYSPEVRQWAAKLQRRRTGGIGLSACRGVLQRIAWSQALMARWTHPLVPAAGRDGTLRLAAWYRMRRLNSYASQIFLSWQASVNAFWQGGESTLLMPAVPPAEHRTVLTVQGREHQSHFTTLLRTNFLRTATQNYSREVTYRTLAAMFPGRLPGRRIAQPPLQALTATRKSAVAGELESPPLARRVLRQNRRIEEHVAGLPQTVLLRPAAPSMREPAFIEAPALPPTRTPAANNAWSVATSPQGFNINQITDQVVRQLDSRLVAARERFGKI